MEYQKCSSISGTPKSYAAFLWLPKSHGGEILIERKFVAQNLKELQIKEYVRQTLSKVGLSDVKVQRTPLGERILISASRPGLVVGRGGANITTLTRDLKLKFKLENPQIEIEEVQHLGLDANIVAEMIASSLERFGSLRFKGIGHRAMTDVMNASALGVEIFLSGKIPSSRAKTWRFYAGYLKKCGNLALTGVQTAYASATLKSGIIGVKVSIMPPHIQLPDRINFKELAQSNVEEVKDASVKEEINKEIHKKTEKPTKKRKAKSDSKSTEPKSKKKRREG